MKTLTFRFFLIALVFALALSFASPASAHGDEPRLEINAEKVSPGGVIEVRGVDFEMDELITLDLVGPNVTIPLGEFVADVEGVFSQIVTLPMDLKEGSYTFRATTDDHIIESPAFVVWGMAIIENGEDSQRTDEDPLLAPMPTYAPGVSITPVPVVEALDTQVASGSAFPWLPVIVGAAILVVSFLVTLFWRKKM